MKHPILWSVIWTVWLAPGAFAAIGKPVGDFTASGYAREHQLKISHQRGDLVAFVGANRELVLLKVRRDRVYYQRLTWIEANPDPQARQDAYFDFVTEALELQPGSPEQERLRQFLKAGGATETTLKPGLTIRVHSGTDGAGDDPYIEVSE